VRFALFAFLFVGSVGATISVPPPLQVPHTVSLQFADDAALEFTLTNGWLIAISGHVGKMQTNASFDGCAPLINMRLTSLVLERDDLKREGSEQSIKLRFEVDSDDNRSEGPLSRVELTFEQSKLTHALITRKTTQGGYRADQLCPGRYAP
jgi:hypothetical protein